jgi:enoyl-CoA hydratase
MERQSDMDRRRLIKTTATIVAAIPAATIATSAVAAEQEQQQQPAQAAPPAAAQPTTLADVPAGVNVKLTVERRGQVALFGLNRPDLQNRVDPETFQALARGLYDYEHDPSLRAAVLFGHGDHFSRGIDVEAYRAIAGKGTPLSGMTHVLNPLGFGQARLTKPLLVAVHGDTWNMAHEFFLAADIRVAAANTNFGQDENTHGRFPGGGSTVRFVREAGWGNAMRYMLTGDHWTAQDAYRIGTLQEIADTQQAALDRAIVIANQVAACAPLGVQTTLESAHLAIDSSEEASFSKLVAQYGALFRTHDFVEGFTALKEGRAPVYHGN